jgi:Histone deacetylase domain
VPSEYYWKRPDMASSGFCLLNTVAVAAAYAMYRYGREPITAQRAEGSDSSSGSSAESQGSSRCSRTGPLRIAIVDIDVHHGNGTEEIVRNLRCSLLYNSLHQSYCSKLSRLQSAKSHYSLFPQAEHHIPPATLLMGSCLIPLLQAMAK